MDKHIDADSRRGDRIGCVLLGFIFGGVSVGTYHVHQQWWLVAASAAFAVIDAWKEND